jgi:hypothetical protein
MVARGEREIREREGKEEEAFTPPTDRRQGMYAQTPRFREAVVWKVT